MYGHHYCPSCNRQVARHMTCCGNPLADMMVMQGMMTGNVEEVIMGEMMGGQGGIGAIMAAEMIEESRYDDGFGYNDSFGF